MKSMRVFVTAVAAAVALLGCGGDGDEGPSPSEPPPSGNTPASDRIEALDTAQLKSARLNVETATPEAHWPAGADMAQVTLGPLVATKRAAVVRKDVPLQIGEVRDVAATATSPQLAELLKWRALPDGSEVAALRFAAEGAQALRVGFVVGQVPDGTVLRFYDSERSSILEVSSEQLQQIREVNLDAGLSDEAVRTYWGPTVDGDSITLEIELPAGVSAQALQLAAPQLGHFTQTMAQAVARTKRVEDIGDADSCTVDVMCSADADELSRAVTKLTFIDGNYIRMCTGTLLNDTADSQKPYVLTANHCVRSQDQASTLETYWFFRAAACGSSPEFDERASVLTGGARLHFTYQKTDSALMELNGNPPPGVVYAGSYFGPGVVPDVGVTSVHHAAGDLQKISKGQVIGYINCPAFEDGGCSQSDEADGGMYAVLWSQGMTQGGSSGSAIFAQAENERFYVVGDLHGGNASCANPGGIDMYGRFDRAFAAGINRWLVR